MCYLNPSKLWFILIPSDFKDCVHLTPPQFTAQLVHTSSLEDAMVGTATLKLYKTVSDSAQTQLGYQPPSKSRRGQQEPSPRAAQDTGDAAGSGPWLHLLCWRLSPAFPSPPCSQGGKNKTKLKKFCALDCSWRKGEEMGLKLQRKERSADREEHFFHFQKPHKAESTQFKSGATAGKGHSFDWSL